jgi:hypothetical protein
VRSIFPTSWKKSLTKYKRHKKRLYICWQKAQPSIKPEVDKIKNLERFNRSKFQVGISLHKMAFEVWNSEESPGYGTFAKGDCRKLPIYLYSTLEERFQTSTSINLPESSKSYFAHVFMILLVF